ncbi:DUF4429 domain-containing protein [Streptomyces mayteni]
MLWAKGNNGTISFDGRTIIIERRGFIARVFVGGGGGNKTIHITSVTAVQWKNASFIAGFIQLTISGGSDFRARSGKNRRDALLDEYSVTFQARQQAAFEQVRDAIQQAITAQHTPQAPAPTPPAAAPPIADELTKLAALRDQGVLTDQDFEQAKNRLLGR